MKEEIQLELDKLWVQGYFFTCSNYAYDIENNVFNPNGEYAVVIGKAGVVYYNEPTAVHKDLKIAIIIAIEKVKEEINAGG